MFITFEGTEGAGKTTQINLLAMSLSTAGQTVICTREPGGTQIGEMIRQILLDPDHSNISPITEAFLFNAARAQLVDQVISPAVDARTIVLCDRYADSTLAYQGYGRGKALYPLRQLIAYAIQGRLPDLTFYLDLDPQAGLARKAGGDLNRMDTEKIEFYQKVRSGYLELAKLEPWRWAVIDASKSPEEIQARILKRVIEKAEKKGRS